MKRAAPPWPGWRLFSDRAADGSHSCVVEVEGRPCGQKLTYNNTTANFKNHLTHKHPTLAKELEEDGAEVEKSATPSSSLDLPLSDYFDPVKAEERKKASKKLVRAIEKDTVRFVAGDLRPYSANPRPSTSQSPLPSLTRIAARQRSRRATRL